MSTLEINLYNHLKAKIGETETRELIEFIDFRSEEKRTNSDNILVTKQDISDVRIEIKDAKTDMIKWFFCLFYYFNYDDTRFICSDFIEIKKINTKKPFKKLSGFFFEPNPAFHF